MCWRIAKWCANCRMPFSHNNRFTSIGFTYRTLQIHCAARPQKSGASSFRKLELSLWWQASTTNAEGHCLRHMACLVEVFFLKGGQARRVAHYANHQFVELGAWQINRLRQKITFEWYPWPPPESTIPAPAPKQSVNRDPLAKAKFYQSLLDTGVVPNRAALARYLGTSRANITQVLRRLNQADREA